MLKTWFMKKMNNKEVPGKVRPVTIKYLASLSTISRLMIWILRLNKKNPIWPSKKHLRKHLWIHVFIKILMLRMVSRMKRKRSQSVRKLSKTNNNSSSKLHSKRSQTSSRIKQLSPPKIHKFSSTTKTNKITPWLSTPTPHSTLNKIYHKKTFPKILSNNQNQILLFLRWIK